MRPFKMLWAALRQRKEIDTPDYDKDELAFLPAALEIQESPPSPLGRLFMWVLLLMFTLGVIWAAYGQVDIVAVAHGKIIPAGKSKVIQPLETGTITAIRVEEGQHIKAGDVLVELDPTTYRADTRQIQSELMAARARLMRVKALLMFIETDTQERLEHPRDYFQRSEPHSDETISEPHYRMQHSLLVSQWQEHTTRLGSLDDAIRTQQAERAAIGKEIDKIQQILPIINDRANNHKILMNKKLVAKDTWQTLEQERIEKVQNLAAAQNRYQQLSARMDQSRSEKKTIKAEFKKQHHIEQNELQDRIAGISQELIKAKSRSGRQTLTSPVDGVVQQLAINTIGGIVTPAQELMIIVPVQQQLEVEAWLENKDIGFVNEGQQAEVKVDAFPFTKYGTLDAEIKTVTHDAIENEQLGWVFATRVLMDKSTMNINHKDVRLTPGMSVSVEIKTGKRRLMEYFLAPLLRYRDESIRER